MTPEIADRMRKVAALTRSPNAGEAQAAKAMLARLEQKYGAQRAQPTSDYFYEGSSTGCPVGDIVERYRDWQSDFFAARRAADHHRFDEFVKRKLDEMGAQAFATSKADRAADWLIDQGEACVAVGDGWMVASSGVAVRTSAEVIALARKRGWDQ